MFKDVPTELAGFGGLIRGFARRLRFEFDRMLSGGPGGGDSRTSSIRTEQTKFG